MNCSTALPKALPKALPLVYDSVLGVETLAALRGCVEDFAVYRGKSCERLLGFWLPREAEVKTAPELVGRKLLEHLNLKDLDIEWWCRCQEKSLGAHFHYDTHPFLDAKHSHLRPLFSSVFYLTDAGGPTVVLEQQAHGAGHWPAVPERGYAVASRGNRWFLFPGSLRHGAVAINDESQNAQNAQNALSNEAERTRRQVILFNFWPKETPRSPQCVQPDFSSYKPTCSWAPTQRHILSKAELQRLQDEKANLQRILPLKLKKFEEMSHSVPMEDHPALPMPSADAFKTGTGFVELHWRCAAQSYLSAKGD